METSLLMKTATRLVQTLCLSLALAFTSQAATIVTNPASSYPAVTSVGANDLFNVSVISGGKTNLKTMTASALASNVFNLASNVTLTTTGPVSASNVTASATLSGSNVNAMAKMTAANITATNTVTGSNVTATATVTGSNVTATATLAGSNITATATLSASNIVATGTITGNGSGITGVSGTTGTNIFYASKIVLGINASNDTVALNSILTNSWTKELVIDTSFTVTRCTTNPFPAALLLGSNTKLRGLPGTQVSLATGANCTTVQGFGMNGNTFGLSNIVMDGVNFDFKGASQNYNEGHYDNAISEGWMMATTNMWVFGIWLSGVDGLTLQNCTFQDAAAFFVVLGGHVQNVVLSKNRWRSVNYFASFGDAVKIWGSATNLYIEPDLYGAFETPIGLSCTEMTWPDYVRMDPNDTRRGTNQGVIANVTIANPKYTWSGVDRHLVTGDYHYQTNFIIYPGGQYGNFNLDRVEGLTILGGGGNGITGWLMDLEDYHHGYSWLCNAKVVGWNGPFMIDQWPRWQNVSRGDSTNYYLPSRFETNVSSATLVDWFDASQNVQATQTAVSNWTNLATGGSNAVQATAIYRPTYIDDAFNGLPGIFFIGDSYLTFSNSLSTAPWTLLTVVMETNVANAGAWESILVNSNLQFQWLVDGNGNNTNVIAGVNGTAYHTSVAQAFNYRNPVVLSATFPASGSPSVYTNASLVGISSPGTANWSATNSPTFIGEEVSLAHRFYGGMAEILVYHGALSAGELAYVQTNLMTKWGIH